MHIGAFSFLRLLVMLRRVWKSLEDIKDIQQSRLSIEQDRMALDYPKWSLAGRKIPSNPRKAEFAVADVTEWNKNYRIQHPDEDDR